MEPYVNTWWFLSMSAVPAVWAGAVCGCDAGRAECPELALLLINFAFLLLTSGAAHRILAAVLRAQCGLSERVLAGLPRHSRCGRGRCTELTAWPILGLVAAHRLFAVEGR